MYNNTYILYMPKISTGDTLVVGPSKRRRYRKYSGSKRNKLISRLSTIERKIKKDERNVERKAIIGTVATYSQGATPTFDPLNLTAQGTDVSNRIGNKIVMTSIKLNMSIIPADSTNICRVMLVYQKNTDSASMVTADLFQNTTYPWISQKRWDYRKNFRILMDKTFVLDLDGGPSTAHIEYYKKCNLPVMYDSGTAVITSVDSGALYLVLISDSSAITDPVFNYSYTITFIDA